MNEFIQSTNSNSDPNADPVNAALPIGNPFLNVSSKPTSNGSNQAQPEPSRGSTSTKPRPVAPPPAANDPEANARVQETLAHLAEIDRQLHEGEFVGTSLNQVALPNADAKPTVEFTAPENLPVAELTPAPKQDDTPVQDEATVNKVSISYQVTASSRIIDSQEVDAEVNESLPTDDDLTKGELHEFELAMNLLTNPQPDETSVEPNGIAPGIKPPLNLDPVSNEPVLDVRDFVDSRGVPSPIVNAFSAEPPSYDSADLPFESEDQKPNHQASADHKQRTEFEIVDTPTTEPDSLGELPAGGETEGTHQEEVFLVGTDEAITINGADGFDTIDLKCFDVACAKFTPNQILVNDGNGIHFRIEYRDIETALFANGCTIDLTKHS